MAIAIEIQPILDILNRPVGDSKITVGIVILIFIIFYIIAQEGGKRW